MRCDEMIEPANRRIGIDVMQKGVHNDRNIPAYKISGIENGSGGGRIADRQQRCPAALLSSRDAPIGRDKKKKFT